jgi:hypothetical protein
MWNLRKVSLIALAGLLTAGAVISVSLPGCSKEDNRVYSMNDTTAPEITTPAKDVATPVKIETATFALG